jgi:hypothetical protein
LRRADGTSMWGREMRSEHIGAGLLFGPPINYLSHCFSCFVITDGKHMYVLHTQPHTCIHTQIHNHAVSFSKKKLHKKRVLLCSPLYLQCQNRVQSEKMLIKCTFEWVKDLIEENVIPEHHKIEEPPNFFFTTFDIH